MSIRKGPGYPVVEVAIEEVVSHGPNPGLNVDADRPIYFVDGVAGFVAMEKSLMKLGLPYFQPDSVRVKLPAREDTVGLWDIDKFDHLRTSAMEIFGSFLVDGAEEINLGELRERLKSIAAHGGMAEFENEIPIFLGPNGPALIDHLVSGVGAKYLMDTLKTEFT